MEATNAVSFSVVEEHGPQPVRETLDEELARKSPEQLTNVDDVLAAPQHGEKSHREGFAEKGTKSKWRRAYKKKSLS